MNGDERIRPVRTLDITADLTLRLDDAEVEVRGYGDLVVVDAPTLRTALSLLRSAEALPGEFVERGLVRGDVALDVRVRGGSIARAGPDVRPGPVSRALGVDPARVNLGSVALAALGL